MTKTGIVMNIEGNAAHLMTSNGEFVKVKIKKITPKIGEIFTGEAIQNKPLFYKYVTAVASLVFILLLGGSAYAYYSPVTSITVNINPSVKLEANRWNKIINSFPLNKDGEKILSNVKLKNKSIDKGLNILVEEAKKENFINKNYINEGKKISVSIDSKDDTTIDLSLFRAAVDKSNLDFEIKNKYDKKSNGDINVIFHNKKIKLDTINNIYTNRTKNIINDSNQDKKNNPSNNSSKLRKNNANSSDNNSKNKKNQPQNNKNKLNTNPNNLKSTNKTIHEKNSKKNEHNKNNSHKKNTKDRNTDNNTSKNGNKNKKNK
jgi:hypothetical protein